MKQIYKKPVAEKISFDYSEIVVASSDPKCGSNIITSEGGKCSESLILYVD